MIRVQELTQQMKVAQLSIRTKQRGSIIDITKETITTGFNSTIYENSAYSNVKTVDNNIVTNVTANEDENKIDINIILILKSQFLMERLRQKWMFFFFKSIRLWLL